MLTTVFGLIGNVLRRIFEAILLVRRPRPIHSRGIVLRGELTWRRGSAPSGIEWVDRPPLGSLPVTARLSRSIGLPASLPDIIGLALRMETGGRTVDLELASTGLGVPSRFMLLPYRSPSRARFGTLLPYRSPVGPVLICARPVSSGVLPADGAALADALARRPWTLRLYHAGPTGQWHAFADVTLGTAVDQADGHLRFDAVRHPLPGASTYPWVHALRQPSYERVQLADDRRGP